VEERVSEGIPANKTMVASTTTKLQYTQQQALETTVAASSEDETVYDQACV